MLLLVLLLPSSLQMSLPGIQSKAYTFGEQIPVFINELTSSTNQIPYDYYILQFCSPKSGV